jgi:hypothetical protein
VGSDASQDLRLLAASETLRAGPSLWSVTKMTKHHSFWSTRIRRIVMRCWGLGRWHRSSARCRLLQEPGSSIAFTRDHFLGDLDKVPMRVAQEQQIERRLSRGWQRINVVALLDALRAGE